MEIYFLLQTGTGSHETELSMHACCGTPNQLNWASQVHFYSAHSPSHHCICSHWHIPHSAPQKHCKAPKVNGLPKQLDVKCLSLHKCLSPWVSTPPKQSMQLNQQRMTCIRCTNGQMKHACYILLHLQTRSHSCDSVDRRGPLRICG